ncbi:MAG: fibronectin type III domain-containing protein [Paramuribaculum sp.]|nr:fibronectin type III domain-containing protein [Paramuribaculum sp.]
MNSIRKLVMMLGVLLASSVALVGCSDDDYPNFGAVGINSLQTTTSTVTIYWTIVPNENCDGYKITINEGTRESKGATVIDKTFDARTANATFDGLKANTTYVVTTQAIPSSKSGYSQADTYEMQFMTAPLASGLVVSDFSYKAVLDWEGNPTGDYVGSAVARWNAISCENCGGYNATLFVCNGCAWAVVQTITNQDTENSDGSIALGANKTTATFKDQDKIQPGMKYRLGVTPRPANSSWYPAGEITYSNEVTSPSLAQ